MQEGLHSRYKKNSHKTETMKSESLYWVTIWPRNAKNPFQEALYSLFLKEINFIWMYQNTSARLERLSGRNILQMI